MKNLFLLLGLLFCGSSQLYAQLETTQYATNLFRGTRVINGHSVETLNEGEMEMLISHRFGRINGGGYELFGLDQASIRIGFDYGIKKWLNVGIGRSSLGKHYDSYLKLAILLQSTGKKNMPISLTGFASVAMNTLKAPSAEEPIPFQSRFSYTYQLFIARKFSDNFSMQIMPSVVHFNLVDSRALSNDVISIGAAGKYHLTKNLALTAEYYYTLPDQLATGKYNSLSFGIDINTGSHLFQLHFTNSDGMIEKAFIGDTTGEWGKGDIHFGFNMSRTFKLKGRRY